MVDASLSNVIPKINTASILNTVLIVIVILLVLAVFGYTWWWYTKKRKYGQYQVRVLDKDSNGKAYEWPDRAGIFLDKKTGDRLLWLEKGKAGLNPNKIPYISRLDNKGRIIKIVTLRRIGVNNYVFVNVSVGEATEFTVGEEDLNNAHHEMVKIRHSFNKESWLNKLAPYIMFVVSMLVIMIVLISLFNKMTVISDAAKSLDSASEKQLEITKLLYNITVQPAQQIIIKPGGT